MAIRVLRVPARRPRPAWSSLLGDHHAILDALVRCGHGTDPRVVAELERMLEDVTDTDQARARPGRKSDSCPQVTVEALAIDTRAVDVAELTSSRVVPVSPCLRWLQGGSGAHGPL